MTPAESRLVTYAMDRLAVVSGELVLTPTTETGDGNIGQFDEQSRRMIVAIGRSDWCGVLAHELGHVEQLIDGRFSDGNAWAIADGWLENNKAVNTKILNNAINYIQRCEHDAEKHAIKLCKLFKVGLDFPDYIRKANAYLWAWEGARRYGRWPHSAVHTLCPSRLIPLKALSVLPQEVESAYGSFNTIGILTV